MKKELISFKSSVTSARCHLMPNAAQVLLSKHVVSRFQTFRNSHKPHLIVATLFCPILKSKLQQNQTKSTEARRKGN
jgi:hypothetical protein